jgi:hypothetical protein
MGTSQHMELLYWKWVISHQSTFYVKNISLDDIVNCMCWKCENIDDEYKIRNEKCPQMAWYFQMQCLDTFVIIIFFVNLHYEL